MLTYTQLKTVFGLTGKMENQARLKGIIAAIDIALLTSLVVGALPSLAEPPRLVPIVNLSFDEVSNDQQANLGILKNYAVSQNSTVRTFNGAFVSLTAFSERGRYLQFPLANSGAVFADTSTLNSITSEFTLSAYINPNKVSSTRQRIISRWNIENLSRSFSLYLQNGRVMLSLSSDSNTTYFLEAPTTVPLNTWTFVAAVFNGKSAQLFVGDKVIPAATTTVVPATIFRSSYPLLLGARDISGVESFSGSIDEVQVFNHARTRFGRQFNLTVPTLVKVGEPVPLHISILIEIGDPYSVTETLNFSQTSGLTGIPFSVNVLGRNTVNGIYCNSPGTYRIVATVKDGGMAVESNPVVCKTTIPERIYWGDMHWHSSLGLEFNRYGAAGGHGDMPPEFGYSWARDWANLDFTAMNEHDFRLANPTNDWQKQIDVANAYHQPGKFVTFLGYEWGGRNTGSLKDPVNSDNHHNVIFPGSADLPYQKSVNIPGKLYLGSPNPFLQQIFDSQGKIRPASYWDNDGVTQDWETSDTFLELGALLAPYGATITPHHLGYSKHLSSSPRAEHLKYMPYVEIYSKWGASEYINNPRTTFAQLEAQKAGQQPLLAQDLLKKGYKIGFVGGSDSHSTNPGTIGREDPTNLAYPQPGITALYSSAKTRPNIWGALTNRRTYAVSGKRIYVDFSINGAAMGKDTSRSASGLVSYNLSVAGTASFDVEVVRDGVVIKRLTPTNYTGDRIISFQGTDNLGTIAGRHYYYLRVVQIDGEQAWSSPVFVN